MTTLEHHPGNHPQPAGLPAEIGHQHGEDRQVRRAAARAFRPRRGLPATCVAVVLAATATLTVIEVLSALAHRHPNVLPVSRLARLGRETHFDDPVALGAAAAVCAVGLVLLVLAVTPGRPRLIALAPPDAGTVIGITRSGLCRHLTEAVTAVDGISRARVRVRWRRIRVRAATPLRDTRGLTDHVRTAADDRLNELHPLSPRRVSVAVHRRQD